MNRLQRKTNEKLIIYLCCVNLFCLESQNNGTNDSSMDLTLERMKLQVNNSISFFFKTFRNNFKIFIFLKNFTFETKKLERSQNKVEELTSENEMLVERLV